MNPSPDTSASPDWLPALAPSPAWSVIGFPFLAPPTSLDRLPNFWQRLLQAGIPGLQGRGSADVGA